MHFEFHLFKLKIDELIKSKSNLIVLKGVTSETYHHLANIYGKVEPANIFSENGKIILPELSNSLFALISTISQIKEGGKYLMLFESFLLISKNLNLNAVNIGIHIIENNLLDRYENPSTENIPDFEYLIEKNIGLPDNDPVSNYYSDCISVEGLQFIEYLDGLKDEYPHLNYIPLLEKGTSPQTSLISQSDIPVNAKLIITSSFDFHMHKYELLKSEDTEDAVYIIDETSTIDLIEKNKLLVFNSFLEIIHCNARFFQLDNRLTNQIRPELKVLLKKYWKSEDFRIIQFYKDPDISKELMNISQGEIIETIIQQCEKGLEGKSVYSDVFLTAPTGAGKSLLFQLPAIYIAEHFQAVTIVISPLIALMKDQVFAIKELGYQNVVCINSELSLIDREEELKKIHEGKTNILYLSPELLLSYDLSMFLGDRKLGLLVIDEAHLVTTWGRDFRIDYWYLGNFIRKIRKYTTHRFPVLAVTATAVYDPNGDNDMVFETLDSLSMDPVLKYLGKVKRDDIEFDVKSVEILRGHEEEKIRITSDRIAKYIDKKEKIIVYCPWTRQIGPIRDQLPPEKRDLVKLYYGRLDSEIKEDSYIQFREGIARAIISTKAFGMGVDIDDITVVYHHAPSGHLADYVQEIGRLARRADLIGTASIDFNKKDLKFTKILYGLSSIKQYQVAMILDKLNKIYKIKKTRNLLVTVDDFEYIFNFDNVDVEQKVKSSLLLLEKDLLLKYRFNVLIVRPKSLFTTAFIKVSNDYRDVFENRYGKYITPISNIRIENKGFKVYVIQLNNLWEDKFSNQSFPLLKKEYFDQKLFAEEIPYKPQLRIIYNLDKNPNETFEKLSMFMDIIQNCFSRLEGFFTKDEFIRQIKLNEKAIELKWENLFIRRIANLILSIYSDHGKPDNYNRIQIPADCFLQSRRIDHDEEYRLISKSYPKVRASLRQTFKHVFGTNDNTLSQTLFISTDTIGNKNRSLVRLAYILETFNLGTYEMAGGETPAIFIRINDPVKLNWLTKTDYDNDILKKVDARQKISVKIMEHFFSTPMDDAGRWDFIEDFFLGKPVDELIGNG